MIKDIIREVDDIRKEQDKFFDKVLFKEVWSPGVDVYETEGDVILLIELAGVRAKDIKLSLDHQNILHIWGKRRFPFKSRSKNCHGMELHFGTFSKYVKLLTEVEDRKAELRNMNGIYKITFKKRKGGGRQ